MRASVADRVIFLGCHPEELRDEGSAFLQQRRKKQILAGGSE
jgi:hypothetical protein